MVLLVLLGFAVVALAHTAPAPFILDAMAGDTAVWHMPRTEPRTVYLTFDDGPNPATTPDLLNVLAREGVAATFFLIDEHITDDTAPIVQRLAAEGHAIGLHSATRTDVLRSPEELKQKLTAAAGRIERVAGMPPCRAFRPHAGWRGGAMYAGLKQMDYRLVGWGWMLWDFNWLRARTADSTFRRVAKRASAGDIIVMHDGDESAPLRPQPHTVAATARLIPALRARGLSFGTVCRNGA
jgi:peptidoglycan/xylan/chitin deacetylase (PgdA/CDA1 family)